MLDPYPKLACLFLLVIPGCYPSSSKQTADRPQSDHIRATGIANSSVEDIQPFIEGYQTDKFDAFLQPILDRTEPEQDDWQSEVFADQASDQLKRLASIFQNPEQITPAALESMIAEDCSSLQLRPSTLGVAFEDGAIQVLRSRDPAANSQQRPVESEVVAALRDMLRPLHGAEEIRAKFKLYRVVLQPDGEVNTQAYCEVRGRTGQGILQQNAVWHCSWQLTDSLPRLTRIATADFVEIVPKAGASAVFEDSTVSVAGETQSFKQQLMRGVDFWRGRLEANYGVDPNGNQGLALGDINGDGLDDLYVCQQGGLPNRMYVQRSDGTLRDVSSEAGVDWMEVCRSALFVDLDNDGDQDLVMAQGWHLMIMRNNGRGRFEVIFEIRSRANLYSTTAADYDNDGDLDLFVCGRNPDRERNKSEGILGTPIPYHDANNGGPNMLWRNDGGARFVEVTNEVGLDQNNRRYSYAASWEDYDNDGDQDLYVANDFGRNNLYRNDLLETGRRYFTDVAREAGVEDISAGMSVTWGDYDRDGRMDIYVSNMFSSAGNRVAYQRRFRDSSKAESLNLFRRHARGNTLFRQADGGFQDVSVAASVTMGRWAWGAKFCDLNNDGWEDLYVANGFITTEDTSDL